MPATEATPARAIDLDEAVAWIDTRVLDASGRRLGRVRAVVADAAGTPWWIVAGRRGRDVIAPVASVQDAFNGGIVLGHAAEALPPAEGEIDAPAHEALIARFGLAGEVPVTTPPRGPRDACSPRLRRPRRLRG